MNSLSGVERRINLRLLSYWEKLREGRGMPAPEDINPDDLRDLWDSCFIICVTEPGKAESKYTYLGQFIVDAYEQGTTHGSSGSMISLNPDQSSTTFAKVLDSGKPLLEEGEFTNHNHKIVKYRQCVLPLGRDGSIEAIFGGMNFKVF